MEVTIFFCYIIAIYFVYKLIKSKLRQQMLEDVSSRYIMITGCDTGFGHDSARKLDKMGCHVFAGCFSQDGQDNLKQGSSQRLVTFPLNVADHDSVQQAVEIVKSKLQPGKGLWGIINNAGVSGTNGPVEWLQLSDYKEAFDVNTLGLIDVTVAFLPLVKKEQGRIVNTASCAGRICMPLMGPYNMTKYAVEAYSDCLRRQMAQFGVSVHIIEPGWFKTNITNTDAIAKTFKRLYERAPEEVRDEYGEKYLKDIEEAFLDGYIKKACSTNTDAVVESYVHALLGQYPRHRYMVGVDANWIVWPLQALPSPVCDFIMETLIGGQNKALPLACR